MHFTTFSLATLSMVSTAISAAVRVHNDCDTQDIYVQTTTSNGSVASVVEEAAYYEQALVGQGNQLGITRNPDYYANTTPKLIIGFSIADGLTYWTVSNLDGDPFAGSTFSVVPADGSCTNTTGYDNANVHTCSDAANIDVYVC